MDKPKKWMVMAAIFWCAASGWAQNSPLKVTVKSILGAKGGVPEVGKDSMREAKLHVDLQNMGSKPMEEVLVEWTYVVEDNYSYTVPRKFYTDGSKKVDLKSTEKKVFDTDLVEVSRRDYGEKVWRGYWVKISYDGKTIFEDFNPQSVKKIVEQHQKNQDKN